MPDYLYSLQSEFKFFNDKKHIILLIGTKAKLANCFITALENEFPNHDVVYCEDFQCVEELRLCVVKSVELVIVYDALNNQNILQVDQLRDTFLTQPIVLAYDSTAESMNCVRAYGGHFHSHLPINVKLDVWLSIIRLILSGGNYICPELLKEYYQKPDTPCSSIDGEVYGTPSQSQQIETSGVVAQTNSCLSQLTERESEVIKLMAAGQQNKVIASALNLSEHTVKLHIHHIISKLNVSNRTEAAALYLNADRSGQAHC